VTEKGGEHAVRFTSPRPFEKKSRQFP